MDFKVSYLDQGLASSYSEFGGEAGAATSGKNINPRSVNSAQTSDCHYKPSRRYKTQLRDFLSSCRTKRKANDIYAETSGFPTYPAPATAYMTGTSLAGYPPTPDTTTLYMQPANITAPAYQTLYPGVDNRYLAASDYFAAAGYRTALAGTYYPTEYHAALGNGYLEAGSRIPGLASYDQVGERTHEI